MIEIKNLTKIYKLNKKQMKESKTKSSRKVAVDDVSLRAKKGESTDCLDRMGQERQRRFAALRQSSTDKG